MDSSEALLRVKEQVDDGCVKGAISTARELLATSRDEVDLVKCGKLLESVHETELARLAYEKALKIAPTFSQAHSALGLLALTDGNDEQAIDHFRNAVRLEPNDVGKLTLLGVAYANLGADEVAVSWLRRALAIEPGYEEANYNLGFIRVTRPRTRLRHTS